jgi:hypothetical protein
MLPRNIKAIQYFDGLMEDRYRQPQGPPDGSARARTSEPISALGHDGNALMEQMFSGFPPKS